MILSITASNLDKSNHKAQLKSDLVSFGKVQRKDRNVLLDLTKDSGSIIDVRKREILQILNDISKNGDSKDISLLLTIAQNLKFGYSEASPMANFLNTNSNIANQENKQNTNWSKVLQNTIASALNNNNNSSEKTDLEKQFSAIYSPSKDVKPNAKVSGNPIFQQQTKAIKLRAKILNSNDFSAVPENLSDKDLDELKMNQQRVKRNLDYFLASSECSLSEKVKILDKLSKMMTPEYEINEQLKDKKVKVLSEVLNDIVVKTPDQAIPNIKDVNQRHHGMCAAISKARKALAYEDKLAYVNSIYSELDNKPQMEVYDVTDLRKKVPVAKTDIDFKSLLEKGYRIVDASTLQWMNISGSIGDGTASVEHYIPFDKENYGMFSDSKLYSDLSPELVNEHNYLRSLVKTKENIESYETFSITKSIKHQEARKNFNGNVDIVSKYYDAAEKALKSGFPDLSKEQTKTLARDILNIENLKDSALKVHPSESEVLKKQKISSIIKQQSSSEVDSAKLASITNKLYMFYQGNVAANEELGKKASSTLSEKVAENKKLFNVAASHRVSTERALEIPEMISGLRKTYKIPTDRELTLNRINQLIQTVDEGKNLEETANLLNLPNKKETLKSALVSLKTKMDVEVPHQIDLYMSKLGEGSREKFLTNIANNAIAVLNDEALSPQYTDYYAEIFGVKPDTEVLKSKFENILQELDSDPTEAKIKKVSEMFGFNKPTQVLDVAIKAKFANELTEKELNSIAKRFGVEPYVEDIQDKIDELFKAIKQIDGQESKISKIVGAQSAKDLILKKMENKGFVLSRNDLDGLQQKFDQIDKFKLESEDFTQRGGVKPQVGDIYKFSKTDAEKFNHIRKSFNEIKRENLRNYMDANEVISEPLKELYANVGVRKGKFWVGEEGFSGLFAGEQVRISEQMTGKKHYVEDDLTEAVNRIKETGKSGVSGTNVAYSEYSGHAQYIADIKEMPVADSASGKAEQADVLFHDNSWGASEKGKSLSKGQPSSSWNDILGYERSDYSSGYGGPNGYILDNENLRTGIPVENLKYDKGVNKPSLPDSKRLHKLKGESGEEYSIFNDVILQGEHQEAARKYSSMVNKVFGVADSSQASKLSNILRKNPDVKINITKMEKLEDLAGKTYSRLSNLINGSDSAFIISNEVKSKLPTDERLKNFGIDSKEVFDSLPENHELKILLRKISLFDMPYGDFKDDNISMAQTHNELDAVEDSIIKLNKKNIKLLINAFKTPVEKVKTLDDMQSSTVKMDQVINWIDKKFAPSSDEELIEKFFELKGKSSHSLAAIISNSTRDQLGIKAFDGYNFIRDFRAESEKAENSLDKAVLYDTFRQADYFNSKNPVNKAEQMYRSLYVQLAALDTKSLNQFKEEAFRKYGVRPAMPEIKLVNDETIAANTEVAINFLTASSEQIKGLNNELEIERINSSLVNAIKTSDLDSASEIKTKLIPLVEELEKVYPSDESGFKEYLQGLINSPTSEITSEFKESLQIFDTIKQEYTVAAIKSDLKSVHKSLSDNIELIAKSDILPRYQDEFKQLANSTLKSLMKDGNIESPKNAGMMEQIENMMYEKSLFTSPLEILHSFVSEAERPNGNKAIHSGIMKNLTTQLINAQKKANLAELEFSIIGNIKSGYINRFKDFMKEDYLVIPGAKRQFSMVSKDGLKSLLASLLDFENDNRTLKLFVDSMGLNEKITNILMENSEPKKYIDQISELAKARQQGVEDHNKLEKLLQSILNHDCGFKSKGEAIKYVNKAIDAEFKKTSVKPSEIVSFYKNEFAKQMRNSVYDKHNTSMVELIDNARYNASVVAVEIVESFVYDIQDLVDDMKEVKALSSTITVPEHSKVFEKREIFQLELDKALKNSSKIMQKILRNLA